MRADYGGTIRLREDGGRSSLLIICGCGHRAVMRHETAIALCGEETRFRDLARALRCATCKRRTDVELSFITRHDGPRNSPFGALSHLPEVTPETVARLRAVRS